MTRHQSQPAYQHRASGPALCWDVTSSVTSSSSSCQPVVKREVIQLPSDGSDDNNSWTYFTPGPTTTYYSRDNRMNIHHLCITYLHIITVCLMRCIAAWDRIQNHLQVRSLISVDQLECEKTSNIRNSATIDFVFGSMLGFLARTDELCLS